MIARFREGLGRVRRAPALVIGVWLTTLALALGPALMLRSLIEGHLGSSMMADTAVTGVNFDWWNEFLAQASGIGQSFVPAILGFAAVLDNLSRLADHKSLPPALAGIVAAPVYVFLFLQVHHWLLEQLYERLTHDTTVERSAFAIRLVLYATFTALVCAVNVIVDYAKIRAVVEDRR